MDGAKLIVDALAIVAAGIAVWQAWKAKGYKNEILSDRRRYALVDMFASAKRAREDVKKLTRPVSGRPMRGVNPSEVLAVTQDCVDEIDQNCHRYGIDGLEQIVGDLRQCLRDYTAASTDDDRFSLADSMQDKLSQMIRAAKQKMDA